MSDAIIVIVTLAVLVAVSGYLVVTMIRSIHNERKGSRLRKIWKNFGLSIALAILFFVSWAGQAVAEWGDYRHEQQEHGQRLEVTEYLIRFGQSTLENWQSEFLQLFSFVVLAAILVHHGSAESRDGEDRIERKVDEIVRRLDEAGIGEKSASRS